jgi:hypothetical protein
MNLRVRRVNAVVALESAIVEASRVTAGCEEGDGEVKVFMPNLEGVCLFSKKTLLHLLMVGFDLHILELFRWYFGLIFLMVLVGNFSFFSFTFD